VDIRGLDKEVLRRAALSAYGESGSGVAGAGARAAAEAGPEAAVAAEAGAGGSSGSGSLGEMIVTTPKEWRCRL